MSVPALDRRESQVLALAGVLQAAQLALSVARQGDADPQALASSLASVRAVDADSVAAVYGGLAGVRTGLRLLVGQLRSEQRDAELIRVCATILSLERKFSRNAAMAGELRRRLDALPDLDAAAPVPADEAGSVDALAEAYLATISTLTPRVRVAGNPLLLKDAGNVRRIRACLLAALRSAVLWRQVGGRGWHLLLQRRRLVESAQRLLGRSLASV